MSHQRSASVQITNNSGGNAWIALFHRNSSNGMQAASWQVAPNANSGGLTVLFQTGGVSLAIPDYWAVMIHVQDGASPGLYVSDAGADDVWKECQLQQADAEKALTLTVSPTTFDINLDSGGRSAPMRKLAPQAPITHVFVVMLENHSFDNIFAMSGIPGITAATTSNSNSYQGTTYYVQSSAPLCMPTDPGHEFLDVVEQLGGENAPWTEAGIYPAINNSGFAANYTTSASEKTKTPHSDDVHDIMACFATRTQLPVIYALATEFAVCDQWFSSLPGPTWPNRFFVHGASSSGLDDSPSKPQIGWWAGTGFQYARQSIYDVLRTAGIPYCFYHDSTDDALSLYSDNPQAGSHIGAVPQVSSLRGVSMIEIESLRDFATDLKGPYPYVYTFIEPHYGDMSNNSYAGGSSQHPMDDVYGGEHLLASVYEAIRNSPYWNTSLLIITYDEHGGFYDSVVPGLAPPPGDNPSYGLSKNGFKFDVYGVRVPAVVVSPLIPVGTVDHTLYDHSSIPKTLEQLFGLGPLTARDANANSVLPLLSLSAPRADCPTSLTTAAPIPKAHSLVADIDRASSDAEPVPESGNLVGALQILHKTEIEMSGRTPPELAAIHARSAAIQTRGQARAYAASVMQKVAIARQQHRHSSLRRR